MCWSTCQVHIDPSNRRTYTHSKDGTKIEDLLDAEAKEFRGDRSVEALNIPGAVSKMGEGRQALMESLDTIRSWRYGADLASKESEIHVFVMAFNDQRRLVEDFRKCLAEKGFEEKQLKLMEKNQMKRTKRYMKTKMTKALSKGNTPDILAKLISSTIGDMEDNIVAKSCCPYPAELTDEDTFNNAKIIGLSPSVESALGAAIKKHGNDLATTISEKATSLVDKLVAKKGTHAHCTLEEASTLELGSMGEQFTDVLCVPTILIAQKYLCFESSLDSLLLPGASCILTANTGFLWVSVIAVEDFVNEPNGTLMKFLESENFDKAIKKCASFVLQPKLSVYVPFGFIALVVALPGNGWGEDEGDATSAPAFAQEFCTFTWNHILRPAVDKTVHDLGVRGYIASQVTQTSALKLKVFATSKKPFKQWKDALEEDDE